MSFLIVISFLLSSSSFALEAEKHFVVPLAIPAERAGAFTLGSIRLSYSRQGRTVGIPVEPEKLQFAVVEPERRREAVGSIDKDVYQRSWLKNNLGMMQKKLSKWVKEGNKEKADRTIDEYRQAVQAAEAESAVPLASPAVYDKLEEMKTKVGEAFQGDRNEQALKQKRAAKTIQYGAIKAQRSQ